MDGTYLLRCVEGGGTADMSVKDLENLSQCARTCRHGYHDILIATSEDLILCESKETIEISSITICNRTDITVSAKPPSTRIAVGKAEMSASLIQQRFCMRSRDRKSVV